MSCSQRSGVCEHKKMMAFLRQAKLLICALAFGPKLQLHILMSWAALVLKNGALAKPLKYMGKPNSLLLFMKI